MLLHWRRCLAILTFLLLLTPLVAGLVAPDKHRIVAEAKHRLGQLPMRRDQRLPQAEMVLEIGVDRRRQRKPSRPGRGQPWRWRKGAPFPEHGRGTVRRDDTGHERREQQQKRQNGEPAAPVRQHAQS